jgi:hypothetical protein
MIYLLLDSTDKKTIKSVSSGEFADVPKEYVSVAIKTHDEEGEELDNIPIEFKEDYSLFEWDSETNNIKLIETL